MQKNEIDIEPTFQPAPLSYHMACQFGENPTEAEVVSGTAMFSSPESIREEILVFYATEWSEEYKCKPESMDDDKWYEFLTVLVQYNVARAREKEMYQQIRDTRSKQSD